MPATPRCSYSRTVRDDVELVAVAGIGVGDDRHIDRGGDATGVVDHLRHRHQAEIRIAERRRGAGAGHVDAVEPGARDHPRGDAVIGAGRDDHPVAAQQFAKARGLGHRFLRFMSLGESLARFVAANGSKAEMIGAHPRGAWVGEFLLDAAQPCGVRHV